MRRTLALGLLGRSVRSRMLSGLSSVHWSPSPVRAHCGRSPGLVCWFARRGSRRGDRVAVPKWSPPLRYPDASAVRSLFGSITRRCGNTPNLLGADEAADLEQVEACWTTAGSRHRQRPGELRDRRRTAGQAIDHPRVGWDPASAWKRRSISLSLGSEHLGSCLSVTHRAARLNSDISSYSIHIDAPLRRGARDRESRPWRAMQRDAPSRHQRGRHSKPAHSSAPSALEAARCGAGEQWSGRRVPSRKQVGVVRATEQPSRSLFACSTYAWYVHAILAWMNANADSESDGARENFERSCDRSVTSWIA